MKTTWLPIFVLFAVTTRLSTATPTGETQQLTSPDQVPEGLAKSEWQCIRTAYEAGRHAFQPVPGKEGVWQARNPGQQWTTTFDQRGFVATPQGGGWCWGLELKSYGFGESQTLVGGTPTVKADGQRLSCQWDATVQEWFVNDQRGLEHGFTVKQPPNRSDKSPLSFTLNTRGTLHPTITGDAWGVLFQDAAGATVLNYTGLKVWDADGKTLPSHFEAAGENRIRLMVDERAARYPITIDPIAQQAYLKPAAVGTTQAQDSFGWSVAVSGDTVVVGARLEDGSATGVNGPVNEGAIDSGAAYVFVRSGTTWSQQAYLKASQVSPWDWFGRAVAISGDTVVIGAYQEDGSAMGVNGTVNELSSNSGAAYVFVRSGTAWSQQAYLKASQVSGADNFGISVAVSGDTVVVGALFEDGGATGVNGTVNELAPDTGAAYIFVRSGTAWSQQAYLKASHVLRVGSFGYSVAVDGDTVVVGANAQAGGAAGVNGPEDETTTGAGAAYVFVRSGTTWNQQAYLKASQVSVGDEFGFSVAVSGDTVVVGARYEDGSAMGVNAPTDEIAINAGAAYVFVRDGTTWSQQAYLKASQVSANDAFGYSVAVAGDTVVVGAIYEDGSATGVNGTVDELDSGAGAAYVFVRSGTTWSQQAYLKASPACAIDQFGYSVAVSGESVIVGCPYETSSATGVNCTPIQNSGAAYIFTGFGPLTSYVAWASFNIPAGQDATFDGDWNHDGILNGVEYVFGTTRLSPTGKAKVPAPPSLPADVDVFLDRSLNLTVSPGWAPVASWVNSSAPVFASGVSLVGSEVVDTFAGPKAYYRYRVVLR